MKKIIWLFIVAILLVTPIILAQNEPTQQFNKIFLDPFYRQSMTGNINYTYTLQINPPDKISEVKSAIITFQMWLNPTIEFFLTVNGQQCNNPSYEVHTTYASAGEGTIFFDCSNIIQEAGTYEIVLTPDDYTGAITGWIDVTYSNEPKGSVDIFGTEYQVGDVTTTFIQLIYNDGITPINNASCFVTYFYPDNSIFLQNTLMTYQTGSNGLYYYDNFAQSQTGVYMVEVMCQYETEQYPFYPLSANIINGTYVSGDSSSLSASDDDYYIVTETGSQLEGYEVLGNWKMDETTGTTMIDSSTYGNDGTHYNSPNLTIDGTINNGTGYDGVDDYSRVEKISDYDLNASEDMAICFGINASNDIRTDDRVFDWYSASGGFGIIGEDDELIFTINRAGSTYDIKTATHFDDSLWHNVCFITDMVDGNIYAYVDGVLDKTQGRTMSGTVTFPPYMLFGTDDTLSDWFESGLDEVCYIKGSDINITHVVDSYESGGCDDLYAEEFRNLDVEITIANVSLINGTFDSFTVITEYQWNDDNVSGSIDVYVYNYSGSNWVLLDNPLIYAPSDLIISSTIQENISNYISGTDTMLIKYNHSLRSETGVLHTLKLNGGSMLIQNIFIDIPITEICGGGELHVTERNFSKLNTISEDVWSHTPDRTLTSFDFDVVNETEIAENVWGWNGSISNNILSLFSTEIWNYTGTIASGLMTSFATVIWEYTERNLTYYNQSVQTDLTDYDKIQEMTWNSTDRNLTYYEHIDMTDYNRIYSGVWNSTERNLTYYEDIVNYTKVAENVWVNVERTLTDFNFTVDVNESLIADAVWNAVNRSLTDYNITDLTDYDRIQKMVWNATDKNLTYYETNNITAEEIWNYSDRNLTYYEVTSINETAIAVSVWDYNNRSLTLYEVNNITAEEIWNYTNRNLTFYEDTEDVNYEKIQEMIWNATNRNLTYYSAQTDLTNYTLVAEVVWESLNRTLTDFPDLVNESEISNAVWTAINRSLTEFPDLVDENLIAQTVWNFTIRNLTQYETTDEVDYNRIYEGVWNRTDRNLTYYEHIDMTNYTLITDLVWANLNRSLTEFPDLVNETEISDAVWSNFNRSLTDFDFDVVNETEISDTVWNNINRTLSEYPDLVNETEIADTVWSSINRSLTEFPDLVNETAISEVVWANLNRTLTDFPDLVNETEISNSVWSNINRTLTDFNFTVDINETLVSNAVWDAVNRTLTNFTFDTVNETEVAYTVWNYQFGRNLTYYPAFPSIPTPNNLTAQEVWEYGTRDLTYYPIVNLTNISVVVDTDAIATAVWNYEGDISSNIIIQFIDEIDCLLKTYFYDEEGWGIDIPVCN